MMLQWNGPKVSLTEDQSQGLWFLVPSKKEKKKIFWNVKIYFKKKIRVAVTVHSIFSIYNLLFWPINSPFFHMTKYQMLAI